MEITKLADLNIALIIKLLSQDLLLAAAQAQGVFVHLILLHPLLWSGAAPFGAINVDSQIGWLIGSKLEVAHAVLASSHYVLDLDLRYGLGIMLTKVLLGHADIIGSIVSISKLLHFLSV